MKQRKKIKYVQKQPPDKLTQSITQYNPNQNHQPQPQPSINYPNPSQSKVEYSHHKKQTYLVSDSKLEYQQNSRQQRREEQRPRYMPKSELQERKQGVPRLYQRQSSHHDQLCIICSQQIRRKDWIWTCSCCCISMHLKCIKQWIQNINQQLDKKSTIIFNWKCPQCNYQYNQPIPKYYCYCGNHLNPQYDRDLEPHSCGEICSKRRGTYCPHPCQNICHSGKCKPCDYQGISVSCQCGKSQRVVKCSQERTGFQCGKKCQKILNCHNHKCQRNCHAGDCQPCKKKHMVACHCGKADDIIDCALPTYSCNQACDRLLDCGYHHCEDKCHIGSCSSCRKNPQQQKTCPCGKYQIEMLTGDPEFRKSCEDPIPVCGMPCSKKLDCGHVCLRSCHQGSCSECKVLIEQGCSCGLQSRKVECWRRGKELFRCEAICKKKRSCGQHICNEVCCRFRTSPILDNHPCDLSCTKMLNCGRHQCGEACHLGLCKKCPVIYSQPQPCPCGKTSLKPPIICGTIVPECDNTCDKDLPCGHRCLNSCHYGACKCYQAVVVACRCGKEQISMTCGRQALCLNRCQLLLPCGHKCELQCHRDSCEIAHKSSPCRKMCNRQRKDCHHFCPQLCHPGQECQSFSCEAEILVKCQCGHRQTMSLCGAHLQHKTKKAIICNKKCENLKRFDIFYKDKQVYYPGNMVQFAFKNFAYLQNLQSRLQRFILHSQESFIQIQYKFTDNHSKLLLTNLFENHYHLNTHFYRYRKYAAFTLMQSDYTMIPRPILTQYIKLISKGTIKQTNLPFQFTISFDAEHKERCELIIKSLKNYLHKYYSQRNNKIFSLHFWSSQDGEDALKFLENQFQVVEFKCSFNSNKVEDQVEAEEIVEEEVKEEDNIEKEKRILKQKVRKQAVPEKIEDVEGGKMEDVKEQLIKQEGKGKVEGKRIPQTPTQGSSLIIRRGIPSFRKNDYPQAKESIQDIYLLDQDELYGEKVDWQVLVGKLRGLKMGPQASEWRIRALIIIQSFQAFPEVIFHEAYSHIVALYNKDKQAAMRLLEIQRVESKSVKAEMGAGGVYLSDHEPQIIAYLLLHNYLAEEKIPLEVPQVLQATPQVHKVQEMLQALEERDAENFYHNFYSADYVLSCALLPLIHQLREMVLEDIGKGGRVTAKDLSKYLLFNDETHFLAYALLNGLTLERRVSKSTKEEIYYVKEGVLRKELVKDCQFVEKLKEKRDRKCFLSQPEELVNERYMTRSFFAFGDFKESLSPKYMTSLVKLLKERPT